jgi:hypothetical protein
VLILTVPVPGTERIVSTHPCSSADSHDMQSAHMSINSMQSAHTSMGMAHMNNVNKKLCTFGEFQSQREAEIIWNFSNL